MFVQNPWLWRQSPLLPARRMHRPVQGAMHTSRGRKIIVAKDTEKMMKAGLVITNGEGCPKGQGKKARYEDIADQYLRPWPLPRPCMCVQPRVRGARFDQSTEPASTARPLKPPPPARPPDAASPHFSSPVRRQHDSVRCCRSGQQGKARTGNGRRFFGGRSTHRSMSETGAKQRARRQPH